LAAREVLSDPSSTRSARVEVRPTSRIEGDFFAADAASGDVLWRFQTGGRVYANPITYVSEGRQFIAIAAGSGLFTFALPERP
jgi:outer membrane protein assembly factor BamB